MRRIFTKKRIGLVLAVLGMFLPIAMDLPGLDLPGRLALGIFLMAASLWVFESVPIWGTSLFVILMQVLLLSNASPVLKSIGVQSELVHPYQDSGEDGHFILSDTAVSDEGFVWKIVSKGKYEKVEVHVLDTLEGGWTVLSAGKLSSGDRVAADTNSWQLSFEAPKYSEYYASLANPIIILFLGGFFLAASAVKYGLDQNLTRLILSIFGTRSSFVLLGLLLTTAILSAFMSNTASTAMMITMVVPIIKQLGESDPLRVAVVLAIPCGANIGGVATPIGSPPNAVALGALSQYGVQIGFLQWMMLAVPLVVIVLFVTWRALLILFPPDSERLDLKIESNWDLSAGAVGTYIIFGVTVLLWVTDKLHGVSASVVAFLPVGLMSILGIVDKNEIRTFSWDVLWLVAGGLSLGITMRMGPAEWMIGLIDWSSLSPLAIVLLLGVIAYVFSNLISNTVAAAIIIPIAISLGVSGAAGEGFDLVLVSVTVGILVSFSMLLPISTPPNAIATATGIVETRHLMRIGMAVGVVGIVMTFLMGALYWGLILGS